MISIPFPGNKRYSYKRVKEIAASGGYRKSFEPFGGSGVLSVNLKRDGVVSRAVINDYDGLWEIYPGYLDAKDWLVSECYKAGLERHGSNGSKGIDYVWRNGEKVPISKEERALSPEQREILRGFVSRIDRKYWRPLSWGHNFTHSAVVTHPKIHLNDFSYFGRRLDTDKQREYLSEIRECETPSLDWRVFYERYGPEMDGETLLIIDPPYTGTYQTQYAGAFTERETEELVERTLDLGVDFLFFNHNPDYVGKLLEGLDARIELTGSANNSANHRRLDVMAYVRRQR